MCCKDLVVSLYLNLVGWSFVELLVANILSSETEVNWVSCFWQNLKQQASKE